MKCDTQTIAEVYEILGEAIEKNKGELPLIALHNDGDTTPILFLDGVEVVDGTETMGCLVDEEIGTEYVPIYV